MGPEVGRGQWGHVHGVPQRLVAGGIDQVSEDLLVVLDASTLRVAVPKEYELLLLSGPEATDTFFVNLRVGKEQGGEWMTVPVFSPLVLRSRP